MSGDLVKRARQIKEQARSGSSSSSDSRVESLHRAFNDLKDDIDSLEDRIESLGGTDNDSDALHDEIDDKLLDIEQELKSDIESIRQDMLGRLGEKHGFHQKKHEEVRDELFGEYERLEQRIEELSGQLEQAIDDFEEVHDHLVHLSEAVKHALEG